MKLYWEATLHEWELDHFNCEQGLIHASWNAAGEADPGKLHLQLAGRKPSDGNLKSLLPMASGTKKHYHYLSLHIAARTCSIRFIPSQKDKHLICWFCGRCRAAQGIAAKYSKMRFRASRMIRQCQDAVWWPHELQMYLVAVLNSSVKMWARCSVWKVVSHGDRQFYG